MLPELYHAHHNRHLEDIPFWLGVTTRVGGPVLELGCGTGRVLVPLAEAGHRVAGIDRDLSMLKYLQAHLPPSLSPKPALFAADITRFALAKRFPLIILPCNTYSTLGAFQRRAALECVHRHLPSGGLFAVSLPNPELWSRLPARSEPEIEDEFILPETGNPVQVSSCWQRTRQTFTVIWLYDQLFPDGSVARVKLQAVHNRLPPEAYLNEIKSSGLQISSMYGDFDGSNYLPVSPHLIILAAA